MKHSILLAFLLLAPAAEAATAFFRHSFTTPSHRICVYSYNFRTYYVTRPLHSVCPVTIQVKD
jgi:hypothetical protein